MKKFFSPNITRAGRIARLIYGFIMLVAGVIAAVLLFLIPETGKSRDPKDLIFSLLGILMIYGVLLRFRPWMADQTGPGLATVVSVVLLATFVGALIFFITRSRSRSRSDHAA